MKHTLPETDIIWRVRLFNGPVVENASGVAIRRFRSQRVGALLAYLALHLDRPCSREEVCEALWPEEEREVTANRLRVTLASLRRQLEPAGVSFGTVIDVSMAGSLILRAETVWCDTAAFEAALQQNRTDIAVRLAQGPLLPGYYDEWALLERQRYELLREELAERLGNSYEPLELPSTALLPEEAPRPLQHRLPLYLTRFFGRQAEQQRLMDLIATHRLVTITGLGGIGKTRLAVETARRMSLPCVFVPLADLPDPERVPEAVMEALLLSQQVQYDPMDQLIEVLQHRDPMLLIVDNAEHLLAAVASLGLRILEAIPNLRMLITSREGLNLPGEALLPLAPLQVPPHASMPGRLEEFPAAALFIDRARNVLPDFVLTPRHVEALLDICHRLEGIPLALELAAARVSAQTPTQIATTLSTNLADLRSRQRGLSPRHRSLRAAMQGSLDLLPIQLQPFVGKLSVFQGGWILEAAQAILEPELSDACRIGRGLPLSAAEFLEELVARSLITAREDPTTSAMRYTFLETVRQFVAERLSEEERECSLLRHWHYFLALAAAVEEDDIRTLQPLDAEQENLRLAIAQGAKTASDTFWAGLAGALIHAFVRGHHRIALDWMEAMLPAVAGVADARVRFRVRYAACQILPDIGRFEEASRIATEMKADAEANGDPVRALHAQVILGFVEENQGRLETAVQIQRQTLQQARSQNSTSLLLACLSHTSGVLHGYGAAAGTETTVGQAALKEAEALAWEFLARVPPQSRRVSLAHLILVPPLFFQGRYDEAYPLLKKSQSLSLSHGTMTELMYSFAYESQIAKIYGDFEAAALLLGAFLNLQERMGYSLKRAQAFRPAWIQQLTDELRDRLGADTFDMLVRRGRQTPPEEFVTGILPL